MRAATRLSRSFALAAIALALGACQTTPRATGDLTAACAVPGNWIAVKSRQTLAPDRLLAAAARRGVVLLGESHTVASHHSWQLQTLAGLYAYRPRLVLGLEMLPRSSQPALAQWVAGAYGTDEFLRAVQWYENWGYEPALYLPLLQFARLNRQPLRALNIDRDLVMRVGDAGWAAIPAADREGLSDPAPASQDYRLALAEVYRLKQRQVQPAAPDGTESPAALPLPALADTLASEDFQHFVEAQLTWDRAMAEALLQARQDYPDALIVGIMGRGHIDHGHGVPHQLAALGERDIMTLVPVDTGADCHDLAPDLADVAFTVPPVSSVHASPPRPRLGITLEAHAQGVAVLQVAAGSVAQRAGLQAGDVITTAAGTALASPPDLVGIIARQPWGTWLPLEVLRDGARLDLVARFPPSPHAGQATGPR